MKCIKILFISLLLIPGIAYSASKKKSKNQRIVVVVPESSKLYEQVPKGNEVLMQLMGTGNQKIINALHNQTKDSLAMVVEQTLAEIESLKTLRKETPADQKKSDAYIYLTIREIALIEQILRFEHQRRKLCESSPEKCLFASFKPYIE
ncbi:MAG TPA: hypothetical protein VFF04_02155 [Candidatus Babeliales bacterium]|nr:hypothetical protein [Candidatus Babeliales bacterium]